MAKKNSVSLISDLLKVNRGMVDLPCPGCGRQEPHLIWRRDRYFLSVNLSACRACGLVYLARGLSGEAEAVFYKRIYPRLMVQPPPSRDVCNYRIWAGYRFSEISSVIGAIESVLDVGAGLGFFLEICRAHDCEKIIGLEPGRPQQEYASMVLGLGESVRLEGLSGSTQLPFAPKLITLFHVLEHLEEPGKSLRRLSELIDPQGWLVIEVPDIDAKWAGLGLQQIHISHRSYFCEKTLTALLRRSGFSVQRVYREPYGIFEGNLRVYARLTTGGRVPEQTMPTPHDLDALGRRIRGQIQPLSLRNGYPRSAARLARKVF